MQSSLPSGPWLLWWGACALLLAAGWWRPVAALAAHVLLQYGVYSYGPEAAWLATSRLLDASAAAALALAWRAHRQADPGSQAPLPQTALLLLLALVAWVGLSLAVSLAGGAAYPARWWRHDPSLFFQAGCLFAAATLAMNRARDAAWLAAAICAAVLIHASHQGSEAIHLEAYVATLAVIALPLAFWLAATPRPLWARASAWAAIVLLSTVVLWSRNRAAIVALAAGMLLAGALVALLLRARPERPSTVGRSRLALGLAVLVAALMFGAGVSGVGERFVALWLPTAERSAEQHRDRGTADERLALWRAAWQVVQQAPLLGVGPGQYARTQPAAQIGATPRNAHSNYFAMLAETGVVGLALYLAVFGSTLWSALQLARETTGWRPVLARALLIALVAYLVQGLFNARHDLVLAYLLAGWVAALRRVPRGSDV